MPVPTNSSALTATVIPALPYNVVQQVDDGGTTYTAWYAYTAQAGDVEIGIFGFGDLVVYKPTTEVFLGPPAAPVPYLPGGVYAGVTAHNVPVQIPVTPGTTYYFSFTPNWGNPTPAILTLDGLLAPSLPPSVGDLLVPDDTEGFPAVVLSHIDGAVKCFVSPFPAGEAGDVLPVSGRILVTDLATSGMNFYEADLTFIASIPLMGAIIRTCLGLGIFFTVDFSPWPAPYVVRTILADGSVGVTRTLPQVGASAIAASNDGTILYIAGQGADDGSPIKRFEMATSTMLADLAAGVATYAVEDLLVLADDTIVAIYQHHPVAGGATIFVRLYAPGGALLATYNYGANNNGTNMQLAYAIDPLSFWIWLHTLTPLGFSIFSEVRASDGVLLTSVTSTEYEYGRYVPDPTATPVDRFGNSTSCPFLILRSTGWPIGGGWPGWPPGGGWPGSLPGSPGGPIEGPLPSPCICPNPAPAGGPVCRASILGGGS